MLRKRFITILTAAAMTSAAFGQSYNGYGRPDATPDYNNTTSQAPVDDNQTVGRVRAIDTRSLVTERYTRFVVTAPRGWKVFEKEDTCLVFSAAGTAAFGKLSTGELPGQVSPEAYLKAAFANVMNIRDVRILNSKPMNVDSANITKRIVTIDYTVDGNHFRGSCIAATVARQNGSTNGLISMVLGTRDEFETNGDALITLLGKMEVRDESFSGTPDNDRRPSYTPTTPAYNTPAPTPAPAYPTNATNDGNPFAR